MAKRSAKSPAKVAGKVIRKQLKGVKSDVQEVKSGVAKQVKSVKSDVKAVKSGIAKQAKTAKSNAQAAKSDVKEVKSDVKGVRTDVTKQVTKGNKRLTKSLQKSTRKLSNQNTEIKAELDKLSSAVAALKKGKPVKGVEKRELSMYNLFVRKQIQQGKTFNEAVRAWPQYRNLIENPNLVKKARTRTITKTKTVVKKVPVVKTRTVVRKIPVVKTRTIVKRIPASDAKTATQLEALKKEILGNMPKDSQMNAVRKELSAIKDEMQAMEKDMSRAQKSSSIPVSSSQKDSVSSSSHKTMTHTQKVMEMMQDKGIPDEQVAAQLVKLYFEEIARLGFKRSLDLDSIINAYFYCLQRLQHREKELEVMRKIVEREETKIASEGKRELFPSMDNK